MTLEEAITHCKEVVARETDAICDECRKEHQQLLEWLQELQLIHNTKSVTADPESIVVCEFDGNNLAHSELQRLGRVIKRAFPNNRVLMIPDKATLSTAPKREVIDALQNMIVWAEGVDDDSQMRS